MSRRLRIAHVVIHPVLVWDDGDELTPGPAVAPIHVPLSGVGEVVARLPHELADIEAQATQPAAD